VPDGEHGTVPDTCAVETIVMASSGHCDADSDGVQPARHCLEWMAKRLDADWIGSMDEDTKRRAKRARTLQQGGVSEV